MPCYQSTNLPPGFSTTGRTSYKTEADCNQACKEGACCEGTTCSVKPACQCQGTGKVFKGVGTVCAGNPCGCCCINGNADATKNEQQCAAAGGTWKSYSCNSPPPSSILLTLSLTNYSAHIGRSPTTTSAGTWNFDFRCVSKTMTLQGNGGMYSIQSGSATAAVGVYAGSLASPFEKCGCVTPMFAAGVINAVESAVSTRAGYVLASQINCNAGPATAANAWGFALVPSNALLVDGIPAIVPVPNFCSGQYSVSGVVMCPGGVQCGTYTLGNPLP